MTIIDVGEINPCCYEASHIGFRFESISGDIGQ